MFELRLDANTSLDKETRKKIKKPEDDDKIDEIHRDNNRMLLFKKLLEPLSDMVDDVELRVNNEGIVMQVMDTMRVAMADIFIPARIFDSYRCDRSMIMGIKIKEFIKILRNSNNDSSLLMHCEDDGVELFVVFDNQMSSLTYKLKLFQFEMESYNFPPQQYEIEISLGVNEFLRAPKAVGGYGEFLQIEVDSENIKFSQKGDVISANLELKTANSGNKDIKIKINVDNNDGEENMNNGQLRVVKEIPIKYVGYFIKAAQQFDNVNICMGRNNPVYFELAMENDGYFRYFIAPKVED